MLVITIFLVALLHCAGNQTQLTPEVYCMDFSLEYQGGDSHQIRPMSGQVNFIRTPKLEADAFPDNSKCESKAQTHVKLTIHHKKICLNAWFPIEIGKLPLTVGILHHDSHPIPHIFGRTW